MAGLLELLSQVAVPATTQAQQRNTLPQPPPQALRHASEAERGPELMSQGEFANRNEVDIAEMPLSPGDITSVLNLTKSPLRGLGVVFDDEFFAKNPMSLAAFNPSTREIKASSRMLDMPEHEIKNVLRHEEGHDAFELLPMEEQIGVEEGLKEFIGQVGEGNIGRYMQTPSVQLAPKHQQPSEFFAALFDLMGRPNGRDDYVLGTIGEGGLGNTKVTDQILDILDRAFDTAKAAGSP